MLRNGTWLHSHTFETTAGVSRYRLPSRSVAQGLEKIECATSQGSSNSDSSGWYLLNVQTNIQATDYEGLSYRGRPSAFTYVADTVDIYPTPTSNWTLRVWYYLRPPELTTFDEALANGAGLSDVVDLGDGTYQLTTSNNVLQPFAADDIKLDIQFGNGNCEYVAVGATMADGGPNTLIVTLTPNQADLITRALDAQGNAVWGFGADSVTFLIPLPQELCNALVSYVGAVVLAEKGDSEKAQVFSQKAEVAIKNIVDIAIPRSKGQPSVYKTRNTYLRRRIGRFGFGGGYGY
jgi:hypothetical protein